MLKLNEQHANKPTVKKESEEKLNYYLDGMMELVAAINKDAHNTYVNAMKVIYRLGGKSNLTKNEEQNLLNAYRDKKREEIYFHSTRFQIFTLGGLRMTVDEYIKELQHEAKNSLN